MTLPAPGNTVGESSSLAGYSQFPPLPATHHHIPDQLHNPATPAALSAALLFEPVEIDDETVRALTRGLQAMLHERDGFRVMELVGDDSLACANDLPHFFGDHARAHCAGDGFSNSVAWQIEGIGAMIGPAGLLPIDTFNPVRPSEQTKGIWPWNCLRNRCIVDAGMQDFHFHSPTHCHVYCYTSAHVHKHACVYVSEDMSYIVSEVAEFKNKHALSHHGG
jgi:hypothetical protein